MSPIAIMWWKCLVCQFLISAIYKQLKELRLIRCHLCRLVLKEFTDGENITDLTEYLFST